MRRLLLIILSLFLTSYFLTLTSSPIHAYSMEDLRKTYCERRSGNQLNLETWYGGRCKAQSAGEAIGFGNIILLDVIEKIAGPTDSGSTELFRKLIVCIKAKDLKNCVLGYNQEYSTYIAQNPPNGAIPALGLAISKIYQS